MDAIRRGAMAKMVRGAVGGLGAAGLIGRGNLASQSGKIAYDAPPPSDSYPSNNCATAAIPKPDPQWEARQKITQPLRNKIDELYGNGGYRASQSGYNDNPSHYQSALRSTSHHWRASVRMDELKRKQSAIETLQDQINAIMRSPMDKLQEIANEALAAFVIEMEKP